MWDKLNKYYPVWWELLLLFLLFLSIWYPYIHYSELPSRVPTHFGPSGLPDAWSPKSPISIFMVPAIMTVIHLFITGMTLWMASVPDPKKIINAPRRELERMTPERAEMIRRVTIQGVFAVKALIVGMAAYLSWASTRVALGKVAGLGRFMLVFTAGIMAAAIYMTVRILQLMRSK